MVKSAVLDLLDSPKLISRKILKFPHCELVTLKGNEIHAATGFFEAKFILRTVV